MNTDITVGQYFDDTRKQLEPHYSKGEAKALANIIFEELLHYNPVDIVLHKDTIISDFIRSKIEKVVARLLDDEPVQYVFGKARFYGADLKVNPDVLIPRPETEELVDIIVKACGERSDLKVLDLCTGSGCIAVTLARVLKFADVTGIDVSEKALDVARDNAALQHVKVNFIHADVFGLKPSPDTYDVIVANPPYIVPSEKSAMEPNVLRYEPHMALFVDGDNPLSFYRSIGGYAAESLKADGHLYFEINPIYHKELIDMLHEIGFNNVEEERDMAGKIRFVIASHD